VGGDEVSLPAEDVVMYRVRRIPVPASSVRSTGTSGGSASPIAPSSCARAIRECQEGHRVSSSVGKHLVVPKVDFVRDPPPGARIRSIAAKARSESYRCSNTAREKARSK